MCHHFHLPQGSLSTFWFVYYFLCGYGAFIFFSVMKKSPQTPNSSCFSHRGECGCTSLKANASPFKNSCRVCRDSSVCKKKKKRSCDDGSGLTKSGAARREWMLWWLSQAINSILLTRLLCSFCPWQVLYYICNITHSFERRSRNVLLWLSFVYILTANRDTLQWPLTFAKGEVLVTCSPSLKIYTKIKKYYKKWKTKKGKKSSARYWIPMTSPKLSSPSKKPDSNCGISESSVRLEEESADVMSQMAFSHLSQILESIRLFARSQIKFLRLRISPNCGSTFLQYTLTHHRCLCFLHT